MEEILIAAAGLVGLAALLNQSKPIPSEGEFNKAKDKLGLDPQDPAANLIAGKYLAFALGDYAAAAPHFALSGDKTMKALAEHELDASYADTAVKKVGMGDEWVLAARKFPVLARTFYDRASQWYGQAWSGLDGVWKDRTRAQLRKLLQSPGVNDPKSLTAPAPWKLQDMAQKGAATTKAYRTGRASYQVSVQKTAAQLSIALQQDVAPVAGVPYEFSAWVLPDGTDAAGDQVAVTIFAQGGKPISVQRLFIPADEPWWHLVAMKFNMPAEAVLLWVQAAVSSKQGNLFIDDVSLKADGRETIKNGSFEDK